MSAKKGFENLFRCAACGTEIKTDGDWPSVCTHSGCKNSNESGGFAVLYARSRVSGHSYSPYRPGTSAWARAANEALAELARDNFAHGRRS